MVSQGQQELARELNAAEQARPPPAVARAGAAGRLYSACFNLLFWPYLTLSSAVLFWPALLLFLCAFPERRRYRWLHAYTSWWGAHYLRYAPGAGLHVTGRELVPRDQAVVYVSNHQSMVDILAAFGVNLPYLWVSKVENFYVPFLGWNMALNRYVRLRRGHLPSILRMVRTCLRRLGEGHSLFVFPEGTRSPDGELQSFYAGAFRIAVRKQVPIVPVVLHGTDRVLPKHRLRVVPWPVQARILAPVWPSECGGDWRRLRDTVRARMLAEQRRLRE
jgi:1-acyl-sn-glycerol-3-phosphate acyltransferase